MIRVDKRPTPPAVLTSRGVEAATAHRTEYDADPPKYRDGTLKLEVKASIYGHHTVVRALAVDQHRKCCFCERKMLGDVEHYRPKNGFQQKAADKLTKPGYYWLAYEWTNLFLACGPCNQRFKRNLFPLADPTKRARSHHDDLEAERPLMLHPHDDDPQEHIGFRAEVAYPIGNSLRGQTTIDVLGLNHDEVLESRRGMYNAVRLLRDNHRALRIAIDRFDPQQVPEELTAQSDANEAGMTRARADDAEYASMVRSLLDE